MKKGQSSATAVATFVIIMAIFMLAYVLLLPQEEREELLDLEEVSEEDEEEVTPEGQTNLLYTSPGMVYSYAKNEFTIPVSSVQLYAKTEEDIITLANKITVSKSWFSDNPETLAFNIEDVDDIESAALYFFVNQGSGDIYIKFNGLTIYEGILSSSDSPIELSIDRLRKVNTIKIGLTSGTLMGDSYTLSSLSVKKTSKTEHSKERRTFELTPSEKAGLKKVTMNYFTNCLTIAPEKQGSLTIYLNGRELFTERVLCDAGTQSQLLSTSYLQSGTNTLDFLIDKGEYSIEGIEFEVETKEKYYPQYNFEISDEQYDEIKDKDANLMMIFKFPDDEDHKKATITINEYQVSFDTYDDEYERKISGYINRGTNYIKIIPKMDFEISSLRVYTEKD